MPARRPVQQTRGKFYKHSLLQKASPVGDVACQELPRSHGFTLFCSCTAGCNVLWRPCALGLQEGPLRISNLLHNKDTYLKTLLPCDALLACDTDLKILLPCATVMPWPPGRAIAHQPPPAQQAPSRHCQHLIVLPHFWTPRTRIHCFVSTCYKPCSISLLLLNMLQA
jgi:hypothetical protein